MKTSYKLLSYSANKLPRAGVLVGETVYDAQKATGVAAHASVLGILTDWAAAKKALAAFEAKVHAGKSFGGITTRSVGVPLGILTGELVAEEEELRF